MPEIKEPIKIQKKVIITQPDKMYTEEDCDMRIDFLTNEVERLEKTVVDTKDNLNLWKQRKQDCK